MVSRTSFDNLANEIVLTIFLMLNVKDLSMLKFVCKNLNIIVINVEEIYFKHSVFDFLSNDQKPYFLDQDQSVYKRIIEDRFHLKQKISKKKKYYENKKNLQTSFASKFFGLRITDKDYMECSKIYNPSTKFDRASDALLADDVNYFIGEVSEFAPLLTLFVDDNFQINDTMKGSTRNYILAYQIQIGRFMQIADLKFVDFFFIEMIDVRAANCFRNSLNIYFTIVEAINFQDSPYIKESFSRFIEVLLDRKDYYFINEFILILTKHHLFKELLSFLKRLPGALSFPSNIQCLELMTESKRNQIMDVLLQGKCDDLIPFFLKASEKNLMLTIKNLKKHLIKAHNKIDVHIEINKLQSIHDELNAQFIKIISELRKINEQKQVRQIKETVGGMESIKRENRLK